MNVSTGRFRRTHGRSPHVLRVGTASGASRGERIQVQLVEIDEVDRVLLVPSPEEAL